jgi:hypothetical protein
VKRGNWKGSTIPLTSFCSEQNTKGREQSKEERAENREQRAENREQRAESREQRAESREQREESREQRAESREQRLTPSSQLAPMSYFNMVSHNPPTIMVSIQSDSKSPEGLKGESSGIPNVESRIEDWIASLGRGVLLVFHARRLAERETAVYRDGGLKTRGEGGAVHVLQLDEVTLGGRCAFISID